jgi:DNA polymerase (family 10)
MTRSQSERSSHDGHRAPSNREIAARLDEVADLLEAQRANQYRVQAWRNGAATIRALPRPAATILREEGLDGLDVLPSIGPALARAIREVVTTDRLATLERLRGEHDPVAELASVTGIGHVLAQRLHDEHGIETLEQLELAAHDGTLAALPGFGEKRVAGIREALASRLQYRSRRRAAVEPEDHRPSVSELLDVDAEYREGAAKETLPTIAPRRFNPTGERWLPVLHTTRGKRHYTALFSNTALAHRTGRTHDWVVLYFDGRDGEHRATVVTALKGPLEGRRVVRGRESECVAHYHLTNTGRAAPRRKRRIASPAAV